MNRRIILVLIALVVFAGGAFLAQQWLRGAHHGDGMMAREDRRVQVLVAKSDLYAGQFIRPENLTWQSWPDGPLPETYFVEGKAKLQDFVGAVVRSRVSAGEPLTGARVVRPGERGFMAAVLEPGERALTVNVTASTGMAGFVFPGDRVDVLLTMTLAGTNGQESRHVSETILRNVRVVGMDQSLTDGQKDDKKDLQVPKTATVEVSPKQAEVLEVASDLGVLALSLRSLAGPSTQDAANEVSKTWDTDATQISIRGGGSGSGLAKALGPRSVGPKAARGQAPVASSWMVNIVRGSSATQVPLAQATQARAGG